MNKILNSRDMDFLLYEFLNTELLLNRQRYAGHSKEMFTAMLNAAQSLAKKKFANHYSKADAYEPAFDGKQVQHIRETKEAWDAVIQLGIINAQQDFDSGGMQLPHIICTAANAYLTAANTATSSYHLLTIATANFIRSYGSDQQKEIFLPSLINGSCSGTMALTEIDQGSALADIKTIAYQQEDGAYRIKGKKAFVTNGDHKLTDNIIHLVLARIQGAPQGINGISLFIVPKIQINADGSLGKANEVVLERLSPKMGCRNATSTVLRFGEGKGSKAYLVGKPQRGLHYISKMMNEARIGVGTAAATLAYQGYLYALDYARQRVQGRLPADKKLGSEQVHIIEHADIRRMLLMQKTYAEGALALSLYASSLIEDEKTADTECERQRAAVLLDLLTPIVKSWPSKYGCIVNDLAIQVLAGSGYIRDYPVEQLYRDQRVNPIHHGTEGIHGLDLLAKKIPMQNEYGFDIFKQEVRMTLHRVNLIASLERFFTPVNDALELLNEVTNRLLQHIEKEPNRGLANATVYLDMFSRVTMAWIWLRQALSACRALDKPKKSIAKSEYDFYQGKLQAARFYIDWELPQAIQQAKLLKDNNQVCFDMQDNYF